MKNSIREIIASIHSWAVFVYVNFRYLAARRGLGRPIPYERYPDHIIRVGYQMFRFRKRVRVVNGQYCPECAPAIFVSNHYKLDDPIYLWPAIYECSNTEILVKFMMRDDFFARFPFKWWLLDLNEVAALCNAVLISRAHLSIAQLKPFLELLQERDAFLMFPGRTRSRSGLCLEYRDDIEEPASVAFFASQAQRRDPGLSVPVVPMGRTWHAAKKTSAIVFGEALYLPPKANRDLQRSLDREALLRMADLIEINALHLVGGICWLRCLHGLSPTLPLAQLEESVAAITKSMAKGRYIEPDMAADPAVETRLAVDYFAENTCMTRDADSVRLNVERILHVPALTPNYRKENPVKYFANQILHFSDVVAMLEAAALLDAVERDARLAGIVREQYQEPDRAPCADDDLRVEETAAVP